jgi:hypothetical protein
MISYGKAITQEHRRLLSKRCKPLSRMAHLSSTPTRGTNGGPTSLIDFDGELGGSQLSTTSSKDDNGPGNLLDDLAGLSFNSTPTSFGQGGSIALGQDTSIYPHSEAYQRYLLI